MKGASLKECEAAFLLFLPCVVNKIWHGGRYGFAGYCCKKGPNTTKYSRRIRVYNTGRMVVFVPVLGKGVKGASLKEYEAAFFSVSATCL